jgi:hypothetical protein
MAVTGFKSAESRMQAVALDTEGKAQAEGLLYKAWTRYRSGGPIWSSVGGRCSNSRGLRREGKNDQGN